MVQGKRCSQTDIRISSCDQMYLHLAPGSIRSTTIFLKVSTFCCTLFIPPPFPVPFSRTTKSTFTSYYHKHIGFSFLISEHRTIVLTFAYFGYML